MLKIIRTILILVIAVTVNCSQKPENKSLNYSASKKDSSTLDSNAIMPKFSSYTAVNTTIDLNGDNLQDAIVFVLDSLKMAYMIVVNTDTFRARGEYVYDKIKVVDIDSKDKYKEIVVSESGPSDDYASTFYCYDVGRIDTIGKLEEDYNEIMIKGDGKVSTTIRNDFLGTRSYVETFELLPMHRFQRIPQEWYTVDLPLTANQQLNLYKSIDDRHTSVRLKEGDKITVIRTDLKQWCLVKTSMGISGWLQVKDDSVNAVPGRLFDLFEGIHYAD